MLYKNKKFLSLLLALVLFSTITTPAAADNSGIVHLAINEDFKPLYNSPTFIGGVPYVDVKIFSVFGVYNDYFSQSSTALLFCGNKQIFFELNTGKSYDSYGIEYAAAATLINNTVFVPVAWVSSYFGLTYSYINGIGNGDIVRICNANASLSDSVFLDAAKSLMIFRNEEYFGKTTETTLPTPSPSSTPDDLSNTTLSISFTGLPTVKMLDDLSRYRVTASFYLTEGEITSDPNLVRRIIGSGHNLGIYCDDNPELQAPAAMEALFTVAQYRPSQMYSTPSVSDVATSFASKNSLAFFNPTLSMPDGTGFSEINSQIELENTTYTLSLISSTSTERQLPYVLNHISSKKVLVTPF